MNLHDRFETYLKNSLDALKESTIKEAMAYSLLAGGKRLRPLLLLSALEDFQMDTAEAMPIAAAIEMVHTYSLIHDDLPAMDNDTLRRGRPTCHIQFDEATAILAGDALLTQAMVLVGRSTYDDTKKVKMLLALAEGSGANGMILGQHHDMQGNTHVASFDDVVAMEELKTGELLALPLRIAAILGNREQDLNALVRIGLDLGVCFQIQDDVLELTSSSDVIGKSLGSDLSNNKATAVHWLGLEQASKEAIVRYDAVCESIAGLHLPTVLSLVQSLLHRIK